MINKHQLKDFFDQEFPDNRIQIESIGNQQARIRKTPSKADLRPGNTVSGPFMMSMADSALYAAILGEIGLVALAVTVNLNINFLHRPAANQDVIAQCQLIKVGKKLIVGEVSLYSDGQKAPIAHATATYALPPSKVST